MIPKVSSTYEVINGKSEVNKAQNVGGGYKQDLDHRSAVSGSKPDQDTRQSVVTHKQGVDSKTGTRSDTGGQRLPHDIADKHEEHSE